jgi:type I restriction enzyme S subunit
MRDSGVEWLGKMPAHWKIRRLKNVSPGISVGIVVEPSKYYVDEGVPALRSLNVGPGVIKSENLVFISPAANELLAKSRLSAGDLVAVRSGQPGTTAIVPPTLNGCNCIDLIIIRKPHLVTSEFLCWYLNCDSAVHQFTEGSGGAIQQHFNIGTAMNLVVSVPPPDEQDAIDRQLRVIAAQLDGLVEKAKRSIDLMREHRATLISAAVTGKIDVRDHADATSNAASLAAA